MDVRNECCAAGVSRQPPLAILGLLRLDGDAGAVGLGGSQPRRLLAALALREGEVLSAGWLIDAVWSESPPRTALQNLRTYIWLLRQSLSSAAPGMLAIEARPPGYGLMTAPGGLDWQRFGDLTKAAEEHLRAAPATAGQLLRRALDLWRGSPVADVADTLPLLAGRIAAMEEARMLAVEKRIEADLRAGLERELVAELAELVAAHPLREQLRASQMTALHRCGRTAEALLAFHTFRTNLAAELGVDLSPRLHALFQAMLRASHPIPGRPPGQDTKTCCAQAGDDAWRRARTETRLRRLAACEEASLFQGRRNELARIREMMAAPGQLPQVVRLYGPAGVGKTAFSCELTRICTSKGWPAVIVDSRDFRHDAASLSEALTARGALGNPADSRPRLLVFDTFEEMADVERDLWEVILPGITGPTLVIFSGRRPTANPCHRLPATARQRHRARRAVFRRVTTAGPLARDPRPGHRQQDHRVCRREPAAAHGGSPACQARRAGCRRPAGDRCTFGARADDP